MINYDCHAHVYEQVVAIKDARYVPENPAPLEIWLEHQRKHGLKGGVIVQVSFLGTNNSELCAALAKLDKKRFAGVAVVPIDVGAEELDNLVAAGVRGVRWNLVHNAELPDLDNKTTKEFFDKLRERNLHLEVHLEGPRLATILDQVTDQGLKVVVDHFGLPSEVDPLSDPFISAVKRVGKRAPLYIKFAAQYRTAFNLQDHARELVEVLTADRVVWGSDWPHTQHEKCTDFASAYAQNREFGFVDDKMAVQSLYGLE